MFNEKMGFGVCFQAQMDGIQWGKGPILQWSAEYAGVRPQEGGQHRKKTAVQESS